MSSNYYPKALLPVDTERYLCSIDKRRLVEPSRHRWTIQLTDEEAEMAAAEGSSTKVGLAVQKGAPYVGVTPSPASEAPRGHEFTSAEALCIRLYSLSFVRGEAPRKRPR